MQVGHYLSLALISTNTYCNILFKTVSGTVQKIFWFPIISMIQWNIYRKARKAIFKAAKDMAVSTVVENLPEVGRILKEFRDESYRKQRKLDLVTIYLLL